LCGVMLVSSRLGFANHTAFVTKSSIPCFARFSFCDIFKS
jgi:hypothetical protein